MKSCLSVRILASVTFLLAFVAYGPLASARNTAGPKATAQKRSDVKTKKAPPASPKKDSGKTKAAEQRSKAKKPTAPKASSRAIIPAKPGSNAKTAKPEWQSTCGKGKGGGSAGVGVQNGATQAAPKLVVEKREIQLEPVWYGEMIECEWVLKNEGDATLSITAKGG